MSSAALRVDADLARLNQALYDEFVRTTGRTSRYEFGLWACGLLEASASDPAYRELSPKERIAFALGRLHASPPATWPSLDLAA